MGSEELLDGVHPVHADDLARLAEVWEASARATHHVVTAADVRVLKPALPRVERLVCYAATA